MTFCDIIELMWIEKVLAKSQCDVEDSNNLFVVWNISVSIAEYVGDEI